MIRAASALAFALAFATGCSRSVPEPNKDPAPPASTPATAPPPPTAKEQAADAGPAARFRRFDPARDLIHSTRRGSESLELGSTFESAPVRPEQRARLDAIEHALDASDTQPRAEIKALLDELGAALRAGKLDEAKIAAKKDALRKAMTPVVLGEDEALADLHALLDPKQRKAAATLASGMHPGRSGMGGQPVVGHVITSRLEDWLRDVGLAGPKKTKVSALIPSPQALADGFADRARAVFDAFAKDGFEPEKLPSLDPKKAAMPLDEETAFVKKLLPLLTPEEREKVAGAVARQPIDDLRD